MTQNRFSTRARLGILALVLACVPALLVRAASPGPATRPVTLPAPPPTTRPTLAAAADAKRVDQLTRRSIKLMHEQQFDAAEELLLEAVSIDPRSIINLYNLACLNAVKGKSDASVAYLEQAADAGWTDFNHLIDDPDLDTLRTLPRYKQLIANKDVYQRKAAERVVNSLRKQFGEGYIYEVNEADKLIFATNTDAPTLAALKTRLQAQAKSQWAQLFDHKPDEYVAVVIPSAADYAKIVRVPGVGGFYNDEAKLLIAKQVGQVMTHEFTHALHAADRAPLGQDHPIWLAEGIAAMFEAAVFEGDVLVPKDNFRLTGLLNAARARQLIPLESLLTMPQTQFVQRANMAYGQAGSFMLYLYEQKLLKKFYDAYKDNYDVDPTGRATLERVTGKPIDKLDLAWKVWMIKRDAPVMQTGPDGAFLGAEFDEVSDGLAIKSVLHVGPAIEAGMRVGDVVVGLNGQETRDRVSFTPAFAKYEPGTRVTLRVRRAHAYVDVPLTVGKRADVLRAAVETRTVPARPASRPATPAIPGTRPSPPTTRSVAPSTRPSAKPQAAVGARG